ncbi:WecB/TagA/CpsF family glycosyltransferase [Rhodoligotrophos ferricapiens]|uniref:WecB/TagA/CpsF family glycosyltransferase n=1 Tax=Rhodoligotrophos ferricapiens TaxID=3069264 RepID=UPI00315CE345
MCEVVGMRVDPDNLEQVTEKVIQWAQRRESRYVCVANVHMAIEAHRNQDFGDIVQRADLATADGMPLVWMLRFLGERDKQRVPGREQVLALCREAAARGIPIGLFGGTSEVLLRLQQTLESLFPGLQIAFSASPPFRQLSLAEEAEYIDQINSSGVGVLFVGLGCPKQEVWMARQKGRVHAVMIGVGAAFDFIAGVKPVAPSVVQSLGLEWLHRLVHEPTRLWRRYLTTNTIFIFLAARQIMETLRWRAAGSP